MKVIQCHFLLRRKAGAIQVLKDTYGVIWNGEYSELITAYSVFGVVDELPRLVLSRKM